MDSMVAYSIVAYSMDDSKNDDILPVVCSDVLPVVCSDILLVVCSDVPVSFVLHLSLKIR
jgi:hypothetical protein